MRAGTLGVPSAKSLAVDPIGSYPPGADHPVPPEPSGTAASLNPPQQISIERRRRDTGPGLSKNTAHTRPVPEGAVGHARRADGSRNYYAQNNFDLIRLIAAIQVLLTHAITHLSVPGLDWLAVIVSPLPGVPAFFFVSGFLITAAWERNMNMRTFYTNRFYRIFPALWACVAFMIGSVLLFYEPIVVADNLGGFVLWAIAQGTVLPVWNPGFLRAYGTGVVNGSLWTIPVELSFYACVPIAYGLFASHRTGRSLFLLVTAALSFSLNYALTGWLPVDVVDPRVSKLVLLSPLPWIGMFCLGAFAQQHIDRLYPLLSGRVIQIFLLYAAASFFGIKFSTSGLIGFGNSIGIFSYLILCLLIISAAYSFRGASDHILSRNDYSYGIYIFHMPIINILYHREFTGLNGMMLALFLTLVLSAFSWHFVERPALRRKQSPLYVH